MYFTSDFISSTDVCGYADSERRSLTQSNGMVLRFYIIIDGNYDLVIDSVTDRLT